jgi:NAD(P)-dependent dehydrogenase (short-subunit alcohol dehydrogenase family)
MGDGVLTGRVALVTGGAKRIGRELVLALAAQGARVVIHYDSSAEEARAAVDATDGLGAGAALVRGDLADPELAAGLVAEASVPFGPLDILVNNAAIFGQGSVLETSLQDWDRHHAINLRAPFLLSQAFARALPSDQLGDIINLNDYRALRPGSDHFAYTNSKVGLHGLTRSLALALAPRIRVNELALGAVLPPEGTGEDYLHVLKGDIPTARFSKPTEVAAAMLSLLTNPSLTGQTICVDGGRHLV